MKKFICLISIIFMLAGCSFSKSSELESAKTNSRIDKPRYTIEELYPFNSNVHLIYSGKGNEFASQEIYVDFIKDNKIQLRISNGGTIVAKVLENRNGELIKLYSREEFYYRDNLLESTGNNEEILLKEPIVEGSSWKLADGRTRTITSLSSNIQTPAGNFNAVEVTTKDKDGTVKTYYAKNVGMVKQIFSNNNIEISTTLEKIEKDTPEKFTIKFYYPDVENNRVVLMKKTLNLYTNDEIKPLIEKQMKEIIGKDVGRALPEKTTLQSLFYDIDKNRVVADFSKDMVKDMNAGSSTENLILSSIVNTLGDYYNTRNVYITLDGKPYSSGHILMEKDEVFKVDYSNVVEYK